MDLRGGRVWEAWRCDVEGRRGRNPVGVGNLLGVDPGQAFVPQANPGLWDAIPLGLCECGGSGCSGVG